MSVSVLACTNRCFSNKIHSCNPQAPYTLPLLISMCEGSVTATTDGHYTVAVTFGSLKLHAGGRLMMMMVVMVMVMVVVMVMMVMMVVMVVVVVVVMAVRMTAVMMMMIIVAYYELSFRTNFETVYAYAYSNYVRVTHCNISQHQDYPLEETYTHTPLT